MALHGSGEEFLVLPEVERCVKGDLSLLIVCGIHPASGYRSIRYKVHSQWPTKIPIQRSSFQHVPTDSLHPAPCRGKLAAKQERYKSTEYYPISPNIHDTLNLHL
jgi:hypothetical protein